MSNASADPRVWGELTQPELDAAYDQTVYAPNYAQVIKRFAANSAAAVAALGQPQTHAYGDTDIEKISYYPAATPGSPIHVHVHGGAWRQRLAKDMLFLAEPFIAAGIGFAILDFISVDETEGRLEPMVAQVRRGLAWLARHAAALGGDATKLSLSGFSSGSHLASAAIVSDWSGDGFDQPPYAAAFLASGMYDLLPVSLSKRSEYVRFAPSTIELLSAQRHVGFFKVPTIVACGTYETPEFRRQARDFAASLRGAKQPAAYIEAEGYNHYEILESFSNPFSPVGRALLKQADIHG